MATMRAPEEAAQAVRAAGLRYVTDSMPGIRRRRAGKGFSYRGPEGGFITDRAELVRIKWLAIPPAWTSVWICSYRNGHLQATGFHARGRKQYRYHPDWRRIRDVAKFDRMLGFAQALPLIRARVAEDQARRGLPREKILATIVRLLELTLIRVGNREYARANGSYGLTTLRDRHVDFGGTGILFEYRGKGGKLHRISLRDRRLARIVRSCRELPGQHLFQYLDESGERRAIGSADVNSYLEEITGQPFTAKDFRTWAGTVLAALALRACEGFASEAAAKRNITRAIEQVAAQLGNTVAVCRKSYIHSEVVAAYLDGTLLRHLSEEVEETLLENLAGLRGDEIAVLALLQQRPRQEPPPTGRKLKAALLKFDREGAYGSADASSFCLIRQGVATVREITRNLPRPRPFPRNSPQAIGVGRSSSARRRQSRCCVAGTVKMARVPEPSPQQVKSRNDEVALAD
jgi:DNA topoisomerase-1